MSLTFMGTEGGGFRLGSWEIQRVFIRQVTTWQVTCKLLFRNLDGAYLAAMFTSEHLLPPEALTREINSMSQLRTRVPTFDQVDKKKG